MPHRLPPVALTRRTLLIGAVVAAGGCTLRPLYGPVGATPDGPTRRLALAPMGGRDGWLFREALQRRVTLDDTAPDRLAVTLALAQSGLAITAVGDTTRFNIDGTARYVLTRSDGTPPLEGAVRSLSGFDTLGSPYATRVARDDAEARVIADLAERVFAAIALRSAAPA